MDESDTNSSDLDELSYWQREPKSLLLSEPSDEDEDVECVTPMEQIVGQQYASDLRKLRATSSTSRTTATATRPTATATATTATAIATTRTTATATRPTATATVTTATATATSSQQLTRANQPRIRPFFSKPNQYKI